LVAVAVAVDAAAAADATLALGRRHGVISDGLLRHCAHPQIFRQDCSKTALIKLKSHLAFLGFQGAEGKLNLKLVAAIYKVANLFDYVAGPGKNHVLCQ
jgi:hypothetical protein